MKELLSEIVFSVLTGEDYRTYVLATINARFIEKAQQLVGDIFTYKNNGGSWMEKLLEDTKNKDGKANKFKLLWFGGINDKTVKNMTGGTSTKEVCLEIGKKNIAALRLLLKNSANEEFSFKVIIKHKTDRVELDEIESMIFVNIISAMRLTVQGGAWSEVGKQTEKSLLFTIFRLLKISDQDFILIFDEMKKKGLVGNREIDAVVLSRDRKPLTIELKLLGIGNPEIGDDLFLIDKLSNMMIKEAENIGIKVVEFRGPDTLELIRGFFKSKNVDCSKPEAVSKEELKKRIKNIMREWDERPPEIDLIKKLKELTK